jgi:hypothetical protein
VSQRASLVFVVFWGGPTVQQTIKRGWQSPPRGLV